MKKYPLKTKEEKKEKGKLPKKPKIKIRKVSASSVLKSFAKNNYQGVKEVQERTYANDNRSLFFNNEMDKERNKMRKF